MVKSGVSVPFFVTKQLEANKTDHAAEEKYTMATASSFSYFF